jgi:alkyl sulfatase BDS1-like metallo-beta-lactamase superfamily hydrolase
MTAKTTGAAALEAAWHTHGYYGPVSQNLKAIDQRYAGWQDGNPARLWNHPPVQAARRHVAVLGGAGAAPDVAIRACAEGGYRWVVEILNRPPRVMPPAARGSWG